MPLRVHRFVSDRCFARVDVDKNGFLDPIEIEVAVLYLYNMVRCLRFPSTPKCEQSWNSRLEKHRLR